MEKKKKANKQIYSNRKPQQQQDKKPAPIQNSSSSEEEKEISAPPTTENFLTDLKVNEYANQGTGTKGKDITISTKPEFEAVTTEKINMYAMASLAAPIRMGKGSRVPIDIIVVVDTSGSMSGDRIALTKVTTKFVVNNLNAGDNYALVQYNSGPKVEQPLISVEKASVKKLEEQISHLSAGGNTDLCGGLLEGVKIAASSKSENKVSAVLLLTDGHATTEKKPNYHYGKGPKIPWK